MLENMPPLLRRIANGLGRRPGGYSRGSVCCEAHASGEGPPGGHDEAVFRAKFSVGRVKSQEGPYLRT